MRLCANSARASISERAGGVLCGTAKCEVRSARKTRDGPRVVRRWMGPCVSFPVGSKVLLSDVPARDAAGRGRRCPHAKLSAFRIDAGPRVPAAPSQGCEMSGCTISSATAGFGLRFIGGESSTASPAIRRRVGSMRAADR